jgi:hypothetical protein
MGEGLKYRWKMGDRFTRKTADARKIRTLGFFIADNYG